MKKNILKIIALVLILTVCCCGIYFVYNRLTSFSNLNGQYQLASIDEKDIRSHKFLYDMIDRENELLNEAGISSDKLFELKNDISKTLKEVGISGKLNKIGASKDTLNEIKEIVLAKLDKFGTKSDALNTAKKNLSNHIIKTLEPSDLSIGVDIDRNGKGKVILEIKTRPTEKTITDIKITANIQIVKEYSDEHTTVKLGDNYIIINDDVNFYASETKISDGTIVDEENTTVNIKDKTSFGGELIYFFIESLGCSYERIDGKNYLVASFDYKDFRDRDNTFKLYFEKK